jgi:hypothetical protein
VHIGGSVRGAIPATGDDLPIFDEAPPRAVDFAPREVRPAGRRGPFVAGAWALAVASLVSVGLLTDEPPRDDRAAVAEASPVVSARPLSSLPSTRMGALLLISDAVALEAPAPARVEVTTDRLQVAGSMLVRAARVEIALEARGNRVLDQVSVNVADLDGGIRPERVPTFAATFDLPFPRPNGTMWVVVTAYDEGGMPLGATRRPFEVGPLLVAVAERADSNPMSELWRPAVRNPGAVVAAPLPTCLPVAPTLASSC